MRRMYLNIAIFATLAMVSCSKSAVSPTENTASPELISQANALFEKYHFLKAGPTTESVPENGSIALKVKNLHELDSVLAVLNSYRITAGEQQLREANFIEDAKKNYAKNVNARHGAPVADYDEADGIEYGWSGSATYVQVQYFQPPSYFYPDLFESTAELAYFPASGSTPATIGGRRMNSQHIPIWYTSGFLRNASLNVTADASCQILSDVGYLTVAAKRSWSLRLTVDFSDVGVSYPADYVVKVTGYFNVGLGYTNFLGTADLM